MWSYTVFSKNSCLQDVLNIVRIFNVSCIFEGFGNQFHNMEALSIDGLWYTNVWEIQILQQLEHVAFNIYSFTLVLAVQFLNGC